MFHLAVLCVLSSFAIILMGKRELVALLCLPSVLQLLLFCGSSSPVPLDHHLSCDNCDFQQCGILTTVDSDEPVQPPLKLRNSK